MDGTPQNVVSRPRQRRQREKQIGGSKQTDKTDPVRGTSQNRLLSGVRETPTNQVSAKLKGSYASIIGVLVSA